MSNKIFKFGKFVTELVEANPDLSIFISLDRSGDIKSILSDYFAETDVKIFGVLDFTGIIMYKKELKEIKFEKRYT